MDTSFETVLLGVGPRDEGERLTALVRAVLQVAAPTDATVVVTHVFTPDQFRAAAERLDYPNANPEDVAAILERHETVRDLREQFESHGLEYEIRGVVGDVAEGVVDIATETDSDRVFVAGRRRSPAGKAVFGSTAQAVLLEAPCPVTYVRHEPAD